MRKGLLFVLVVVLLGSCLKHQDFPNRPDLEFIAFYANPAATSIGDSLGFVKLRFTDGDGDLGLGDGDTLGVFHLGQPYYYNLFIRYFEKHDGVYEEVIPSVDLPLNVRFKRLTATGGNGALEGTMDVGVIGSPSDTVRYEMYIVDRALNHSDTIVTPDILPVQ